MFYNVNDASYWYKIDGEGQTIVLLHGFTGSSSTWEKFVESWRSDFQLVTVDLPGHGKTKTETPRSMETCCNDLMRLFEHLQLQEIHLVGYSMGGRTALSFAIAFPEYIKTLTLESASPGLELLEERENRISHDEKLALRIKSEGLVNFVDFWESIPLFETQKKLSDKIRKTIRKERLAQTEEGLAQSLRYMGTGSQPSCWHKLDQLNKPVLLIVGMLDTKFVQINIRMDKSLQSSRLVVVEDAGHAIHVEQADFFGKMVTEFIHATI
ncbi:2-succinyl-6-hydroxy-2,4-cyclohexadiene-1-carboxylate synthase [Virgibacillus ndiopensis]|uniref:2-succinyl-6-hydroxy-2, 4-cyclohexadiene-1-carboxylate synthase n=1 Tax=Virgibacillus ndiopensis TaxID=2004408 RepID=UPI000C081F10|nr:2-succinyl-6-hydroxy-2,4-cyclohexadiene-1-carboxylate synthase [Virgibacillus ndiopensis]